MARSAVAVASSQRPPSRFHSPVRVVTCAAPMLVPRSAQTPQEGMRERAGLLGDVAGEHPANWSEPLESGQHRTTGSTCASSWTAPRRRPGSSWTARR